MTQIKDALVDFNPWWKREFKVDFKEREIYTHIQKYIKMRHIIALTGLRRVGKTTIMLKIIEDYIKDGYEPKNILYFSFDEFKDSNIMDIIKIYEEITEKDIRNNSKYLILFDEIQKLNGWDEQLKSFYDTFKNIKIIISGSESLFINRKTKETLAGRMFEFEVKLLTFKEFIIFKGAKSKPIGIYEKEIKKLFIEFMQILGFPELVDVTDNEIIKKYVRESIIEKVIYRDLTNLVRIKDVSKIESIINLFMEEPGQLIEITKLASDLGITRQTMSLYLNYLEQSFLIRKLYNFSKSRRKVERKLKKYYPSIISPELAFKDDDYSKSKVFEWLIVNELNAEFFWRDMYKNEVDIVLTKEKIKPIEVKFGKIDFNGIKQFMKDFKLSEGYIISFDKEDKHNFDEKVIHVIPAFKWLLELKL